MDMGKVNVIETVYTQTQKRVEMDAANGLHVKGNVTEQNGNVTAIDSIVVSDPEAGSQSPDGMWMGGTLWDGYANPNVGGNFHTQGRELDVMEAVTEFVGAVRANS